MRDRQVPRAHRVSELERPRAGALNITTIIMTIIIIIIIITAIIITFTILTMSCSLILAVTSIIAVGARDQEEDERGGREVQGPGRRDDEVGNPHRAQISRFELIPLLKLDKQFPVEHFEAASNSRQQYLSQ